MKLRELRDDEHGFVAEMVYVALDWRPDVDLPFPKEELLQHPQVSVFHMDWGRDGDAAIVAEEDGHPIGLCWYRFFTEDAHGEGFVDEQTPELGIAVLEGHRGRGIGLALMEAMHKRARTDGIERISLSVDADNPAKRLYARLGYVDYQPDDDLGRMLLDLDVWARNRHSDAAAES